MKKKVLIIGAGPAGLAAAYEFLKKKKLKEYDIEMYDEDAQVGGISKTLEYKGYRFDLGGHRFYTKFPEIETFYKTFLAKDMLVRDRLSRIYYGKKFYNYPLSAVNALVNLGPLKTASIITSWGKRQLNKHNEEITFDHWVSNRFGDELFNIFFKSYTEKVWGIPTSVLSADWAAQRIENFNLPKAITNALFKTNSGVKTVITKFYYPKYGPGMLYEKMKKVLEANGVKISVNHKVTSLRTSKNKVSEVIIKNLKTGKTIKKQPDYVISTMPFDKLILALQPPKQLEKEMSGLRFRNFITVNFIIKSNPFPDQWIYIHEPGVKVGRIQNFRNWSPFMVKTKENNTPIGMEYFAQEGDALWSMKDKQLLQLAKKEFVEIGLAKEEDVLDGFVYRVKNAYPVYKIDYQTPLKKAKEFVASFTNVYLCGRGGLFRYNNQDHSILTGFYAARNIIAGENVYNIWSVNEETSYLES